MQYKLKQQTLYDNKTVLITNMLELPYNIKHAKLFLICISNIINTVYLLLKGNGTTLSVNTIMKFYIYNIHTHKRVSFVICIYFLLPLHRHPNH